MTAECLTNDVPALASSRMRGGARRSSLLALVLLCWSVSLTFADNAMSQSSDFDIGPQPVVTALHEWSRQADVQVMVGSREVDGQRTNGVQGRLSAANALAALLKDTNLTYELVGENTVAVKRIATGPQAEPQESSPRSTHSQEGNVTESEGRAIRSEDSEQSTNRRQQMRGSLEEIVVTAQKRGEERLQEVPISISVLTGDDLDSSTSGSLNDVIRQVPGVYSYDSSQNGGTKFAIRGVASNPSLFSGSSTAAYYLDEVPFAFGRVPITPDANAYDMERVEVLRGPQGTLYGASSLNGVIRVITKDSDLDEFKFKARASTSNTEEGDWNHRSDLAVNVPIIDGKLGARAVVGYQDLSGWIEQPATGRSNINDAEVKTLRLKVDAKPVDEMKVELLTWFNRDDRGAPSGSLDDFTNTFTIEEPIETDYDTYGLTVGYDFSSISVVSATSYMDYESVGVLDAFGLDALTTTLATELFTQEIRLHSTYEGPWQWSFGGIYRDAKDHVIQFLPVLQRVPADRIYGSEAYAIFGETTYGFADGSLEVTAGLRYFEDRTRVESISIPGVAAADLLKSRTTFDALTPRVVLSWHPDDELTIYGSYSQGFRSGFGLDQSVLLRVPNARPVKEDTLTNYELGTKGILMGGRVSYEVAAYYIDWTDTQQLLLVPITQNLCCMAIQTNGEDISGVGFDIGAHIEIVKGLSLGLSASWNDLGFDAEVRHPNGTLLFEKGERPDDSPETTLGAALDYVMQIGARGYETRFSANASYTSRTTNHSLGSGVEAVGDSFLNVGLRMSLLSPSNWSGTIYADNLANEYPVLSTNAAGDSRFFTRPRPRTIGLQVEYRY